MPNREDGVRLQAFGSIGLVAVTDPGCLERAEAAVRRTVAEFDRACSRFRHDSELSAVNASAGTPVTVGPLLLEAVTAALRAARLTGGDVDPTVGRALIALGYDRDFASLASTGAAPGLPEVGAVPGWRTVSVDVVERTVRVTPGVTLDLGATAKALAADRAAAQACGAAGCGVLVSFGGDLAVAGPAPEDGWRIRVTDDHRSGVDAPGQWISLSTGGLATSSTVARRWRTRDGTVHHLLDPSTGRSAAGVWRTVSVTAASCLDANTASTAAIIRSERAAWWLEALGLPSRLVSTGGTVRHLAGWPSEGEDLPDVASLSAQTGAL